MRKVLLSLALIGCLIIPASTPRFLHGPWSPKDVERLIDKTVIVQVYTETGSGTGSGVIISKSGLVLTAAHVIGKRGQPIVVAISHAGVEYPCDVINMNTRVDLALLQIKNSTQRFKYAKIQKSKKVGLGQQVLIVGHPNLDYWMVSIGIVSRTSYQIWYLARIIETSAYVNPGSSGGPVFNTKSEVIGIVSAMQVRLFVPTGVGYVVHINSIQKFMRQSAEKIKAIKIRPRRYRLGDIQEPVMGVR